MEITEAEYARLKSLESSKGLSLKVSKKGAVQLDGLRRFPVTFYGDEWITIFGMKDQILEFITAHAKELAAKKEE